MQLARTTKLYIHFFIWYPQQKVLKNQEMSGISCIKICCINGNKSREGGGSYCDLSHPIGKGVKSGLTVSTRNVLGVEDVRATSDVSRKALNVYIV